MFLFAGAFVCVAVGIAVAVVVAVVVVVAVAVIMAVDGRGGALDRLHQRHGAEVGEH